MPYGDWISPRETIFRYYRFRKNFANKNQKYVISAWRSKIETDIIKPCAKRWDWDLVSVRLDAKARNPIRGNAIIGLWFFLNKIKDIKSQSQNNRKAKKYEDDFSENIVLVNFMCCGLL